MFIYKYITEQFAVYQKLTQCYKSTICIYIYKKIAVSVLYLEGKKNNVNFKIQILKALMNL